MKKRFYKDATAAKVDGGFAVHLDGRGIKTPAGTPLVIPTQALAEAIAAEWQNQGDEIDPTSMALMPLSGTAIDRIADIREDMIEGLLKYAQTDLLCYRAEHPERLVLRQAETWQPLLEWAADDLGARLVPVHGIIAVEQDSKALDVLRLVLAEYDNWVLTALGELVGISGSLIIGLALVKGRVNVDEALCLCHVDEDHQNEDWGEDFEARERRKNIASDVQAAYQFFELLTKA